nr:RNA-directed DNA polymerase, eukaryota [Tanacetum cinerariifolium]
MDRLIGNLCTLWIDCFHLHANAVRYERPSRPAIPGNFPLPNRPTQSGSFANMVKGSNALNSSSFPPLSTPSVVLDDSCISSQDLSFFFMGKVRDPNSISNLYSILNKEGFMDVSLSYLGGLWVLIESGLPDAKLKLLQHTGVKSWFVTLQDAVHDFERNWGEVSDIEESPPSSFARKHLCIRTKQVDNILETFKFIFKGKTYMARAKELFVWTPSFKGNNSFCYSSEDESSMDANSVHISPSLCDDDQIVDSAEERVSETLFGVNPPLDDPKITSKVDVQPSADPFGIYDLLQKPRSDLDKDSSPSLPHPPGFTPTLAPQNPNQPPVPEKKCSSDPIIHTKEKVSSPKINSKVFSVSQEIPENDIPNVVSSIPSRGQSNVLKRTLWSYISELISRWDGEALLLGDFNEVRSADERLGSEFDHSGARSFNRFISTSGLLEIKMEGYFFTWSLSLVAKMSKLDRFLVSEEMRTDFGPSPFRTYHSWFTRDGFETMVEQAWSSFSHSDSNSLLRFKKKLQDLKKIIRAWIKENNSLQSGIKISLSDDLAKIDKELDRGMVSDNLLTKRLELSQKLKVPTFDSWCFFDGDWISNPVLIKDAFKENFASQFKQPASFRLKLNFPFPKRLSSDQVTDLECDISRSKIRKAVWECGENKSPGPDGFSFEFFRRHWNCIGPDFCLADESFFSSGILPRGCNASFIALIPKVLDAKFVSDFRPISLIGSVYKVISKILANRLAMLILDIVSDSQSAFVAKRSILDGPFILNEILAWCKRKKKQALIFK